MKTYWGSGGVAAHTPNLVTYIQVSYRLVKPLYTRGKSPWYPLDTRMMLNFYFPKVCLTTFIHAEEDTYLQKLLYPLTTFSAHNMYF